MALEGLLHTAVRVEAVFRAFKVTARNRRVSFIQVAVAPVFRALLNDFKRDPTFEVGTLIEALCGARVKQVVIGVEFVTVAGAEVSVEVGLLLLRMHLFDCFGLLFSYFGFELGLLLSSFLLQFSLSLLLFLGFSCV
jgi:hypothetical protein